MREIKFRAWYKRTRVWVKNIDPVGLNLAGDDVRAYAPECEWVQYTGLKDKNGREIYEGDVLKTTNELTKLSRVTAIRYHATSARYAGIPLTHPFEVIGNIYENPELLKRGTDE